MKIPFDDTLPEEGEPQYEELTTRLQQAYRKPVSVTPDRQAQILARVRERLMQTDQGDPLNGHLLVPVSAFIEKSANEDQGPSLNGNLVVPQPGVLNSSPHQAESPAGKPRRDKRRLRLMALLAAAMIIVLLLGSFLFLAPFRAPSRFLSQSSHTPGTLSLQVTPSRVPLGGMLTLRGSNFYPSGRVGLTRDANIPIPDTDNHSVIRADKTGSFSDTVWVDPSSWGSGQHTIRAEDAHSHRYASFPVTVTGQTSQRPPHQVFPAESIDLGSGDQTTNSTQPISLNLCECRCSGSLLTRVKPSYREE